MNQIAFNIIKAVEIFSRLTPRSLINNVRATFPDRIDITALVYPGESMDEADLIRSTVDVVQGKIINSEFIEIATPKPVTNGWITIDHNTVFPLDTPILCVIIAQHNSYRFVDSAIVYSHDNKQLLYKNGAHSFEVYGWSATHWQSYPPLP